MPGKKKSEIFDVSDDEVEEEQNTVVEDHVVDDDAIMCADAIVKEPVKKVRKKRVISPETRARLKLQLQKGRETSLANRRKKKLLNDMTKEKQKEAKDEELMKHLESKKIKSNLSKENERLRLKLQDLERTREKRPDTPQQKEEKQEVEPVKKMVTIKEVVKPVAVVQPPMYLIPKGFGLGNFFN